MMRNALFAASLFALTACSSDEGADEGQVFVTAYGEAFIEEGIPASEMADGWAVSFERFDVTISEVAVAGVLVPTPGVTDISQASDGMGQVLGQAVAPTGSHEGSSFVISKVSLSGAATKDAVTKTFDWTFDAPTRYSHCETHTEVSADTAGTFQITVHADHFFYNSLVSESPEVRFQALADADADNDGAITKAELEGTDIGAYDPGSTGEADNLWAWLVAQSRTLGHVDGEGHCDAAPL